MSQKQDKRPVDAATKAKDAIKSMAPAVKVPEIDSVVERAAATAAAAKKAIQRRKLRHTCSECDNPGVQLIRVPGGACAHIYVDVEVDEDGNEYYTCTGPAAVNKEPHEKIVREVRKEGRRIG